MRRQLVFAVLALALLAPAPPAVAEEESDRNWTVTGEIRTRGEYLENYIDFEEETDDTFSFLPYRVRLGVSGSFGKNVEAAIEVQSFGAWGNQPPLRSAATFFGPLFQNIELITEGGEQTGETALYQAWARVNKIGGKNVSLTLGRQEFQIGDGLIIGNEPFYNGNVFDGAKILWDSEKVDITAFAFMTAERNDIGTPGFSGFGSEDQNLVGVLGSWPLGEKRKTDLDMYIINFRDGEISTGKPSILTAGAHWWRSITKKADLDAGRWDWSIEAAYQDGSWLVEGDSTMEDLTQKGWIFNGSVGWNYPSGDAIHRFSAGVLAQSGDDNLIDDDVKGWFALFPTVHNRFGLTDFFGGNPFAFGPGIAAGNVTYTFSNDEGKHVIRGAAWLFLPVEDKVTVSGGTVELEDYGREIDLEYWYTHDAHLSVGFGGGMLSQGAGLTGSEQAPDDTISRFFGQMRITF